MIRTIWGFVCRLFFRIDAETIHRFIVTLIRAGSRVQGGAPLAWISGARSQVLLAAPAPRVFGLEFGSRVGLAAGFDKDAEILEALPLLGFGFAEIGTVTPRPQPGNDRPRLFRNADKRAIFNRMGFNGLGASVVSLRLQQARKRLPARFRVGVNIGKNKDTPAEGAATDYARAAAAFEGLADYLVVNVSSPNTPGLRALQTVEALLPILGAVNEVISRWSHRPPLLLKIAPEVRGQELAGLLAAESRFGIDGWVLTNTLGGTWHERRGEGALLGGYSGAPLTEHARHSLIEARAQTRLPIISVGGIMDVEEALLRRREGADLIQIYSGWIYEGPTFPSRVARRLLDVERG